MSADGLTSLANGAGGPTARAEQDLLSVIAVFEGRLAAGRVRRPAKWECELGLERARAELQRVRSRAGNGRASQGPCSGVEPLVPE